jgi:hypothetical protein
MANRTGFASVLQNMTGEMAPAHENAPDGTA